MTFYWWSHWFWITFISAILVNAITYVHTYPSQEFLQDYTTPPEGQQSTSTDLDSLPTRQTTKLYQTTASLVWPTTTPTNTHTNIMDLTLKPIAATATPSYSSDKAKDAVPDDDSLLHDDDMDDAVDPDLTTMVEAQHEDTTTAHLEQLGTHNQYEFKRSASFDSTATLPSEQLNNYTNFSSVAPNSSKKNGNSSQTEVTAMPSAAQSSSTGTSATALGAVSTAVPLLQQSSSTAGEASAATPSTPKIHTEWLDARTLHDADQLQKAPFTLENANKEEELRRAENEHRSRKSKVLSAEYKHINRYINFSSDTKSLLTRSASAAPNVAAYDADEGNISSEALAIQRTYFLDAGAISAICFTVFGICCTVGTIGIVLYRRRYLNKPQALSEPDSSVYIDDSTMRVSDNSDEMYSLDNDSFLNSLEAMTIQNYWTDTVKHTKL